MAAIDSFQILQGIPITSHCFNAQRTEVAISPSSNQVSIYKKNSSNFELLHSLPDHDKLVTCIDWAPLSNRIVTCSQDRNAYVWTFDKSSNQWNPVLVLLRINRAATHVRWSPKEDKFAVASGARLVSVCYFEEENNWWVSKHLKKPIRSTVLSVDWHPENILLATGSSDMKARVFSAWIKGIDPKASDQTWGEKLPFGTVCGEFNAGGWVHGVGFSPNGTQLAFCAHDSTVTIASGPQNIQVVYCNVLPFVTLVWTGETQIVAAGHDYAPFLISKTNSWALAGKIDNPKKKESFGNTALNKFKAMDSRAQQNNNDQELGTTTHQNTITTLLKHVSSGGRVTQLSSSGVDGQIVIWDMLSAGFQSLNIK